MTAGGFVAAIATEPQGSIEVWTGGAGSEATVATGQYKVHTSRVGSPRVTPCGGKPRRPATDTVVTPKRSTGVLLDAGVGPLALLRTMAAVDDDTTVYVVTDRTAAAGNPAAAGALVLARTVGAVALEVDVRPGESAVARAARDFGLARRHHTLAFRGAMSTLSGRTPLSPPVAFPVTVPVRCRVLDGDGRHVLVSVGDDPVHRLVPHELITGTSGGFATVNCRVVDATRSPVALDVPGIPVDGPATARLSFMAQTADASALAPVAALNAARP